MTDHPRQASSITVARCTCGSLHLQLLDRDGKIFAVASMPLEVATAFVSDIAQEVELLGAGAGKPEGIRCH